MDPLLAALVGKRDPSSLDRLPAQEKGKPLASSSTLNRFELTRAHACAEARHKKIVADPPGADLFRPVLENIRARTTACRRSLIVPYALLPCRVFTFDGAARGRRRNAVLRAPRVCLQ